jgi:hypothetical protein
VKPWDKSTTKRLLERALILRAAAEADLVRDEKIAEMTLRKPRYQVDRSRHQVAALEELLHRQEAAEAGEVEREGLSAVEMERTAIDGFEAERESVRQRLAAARAAIGEIATLERELKRLDDLLRFRRVETERTRARHEQSLVA